MSPATSTRWCPTPEQLMILEEMYRGGIRTPNGSQIQQITAHLSFYGKIEGKNVFYWFQNHKARDRQKLRRKLSRQQQQLQQQTTNHHLLHHFEASPSTGFQQFHHYNLPQFLPQEGLQEASTQVMNYTWKVDNPESDEMEKWMKMYGRDWMMMMDVGPAPPCYSRPLKTLELFPINSTNLKDECSTSKQHVSFSTTTN